MNKKTSNEIRKFYSKKDIVENYDNRRFKGFGGKYVNQSEISLVLTILKETNIKNGRLLDLGTGKGRLSLPLKKAGYDVYCLDSSPEMIKVLKKYFTEKKLLFQSVFKPIKGLKKIGVVTSLRFFDHFNIKDQKRILQNIKPNLSKNGYIIFTCLNKNSLESLFSVFFPYRRSNFFYTRKEYQELFEKLGLKVVSREQAFFLPRGLFLHLPSIKIITSIFAGLNSLLSKLFPDFNAYLVYFLKQS